MNIQKGIVEEEEKNWRAIRSGLSHLNKLVQKTLDLGVNAGEARHKIKPIELEVT